MKVVCDGCQAKYKLTDGRLAGRKLKFRCRKCGNTILIDGAEIGPARHHTAEVHMSHDPFSQEAAPAFEPTLPEWYLSINGEPYGPCSTEQMASMLRDGQVPWETHVWREGYPEWKLAGDSNTLVRAVAALFATRLRRRDAPPARSEAPAYEEAGWSPAAEYDPPPASNGGYAYAAGSVDHDYAADDARAPDASYEQGSSYGAAGGYEYGSYENQPADQSGTDYGQAESDNAEPARYGAGYAGASVAHDDVARAQYVDPNTAQAGYSPDEPSGLIDIRALSALAGSRRNASLAEAGDRHSDPSNDRFALTNPRGRFSEGTIDTLAPMARGRRYTSRAIPFAIMGGTALIAVAAFAIYSSPTPTRGAVSAITEIPDEAPVAQPIEPSAAPTAVSAPDPAPTLPPQVGGSHAKPAAASAPGGDTGAAHGGVKPNRSVRRSGTASDDSGESHGTPASERVGAPIKIKLEPNKPATAMPASDSLATALDANGAKPEVLRDVPKEQGRAATDAVSPTTPAGGHDPAVPAAKEATQKRGTGASSSIDDLLDSALAENDKDGAKQAVATNEGSKLPAPAGGAERPAHDAVGLASTPSREQVLGAMRAIEPDVRACTQGQKLDSYTAAAAFTVTGETGRVGSVRVTGIQGPVGSCIARAVRSAMFQPFAKSQLRINFPFRLGP